MHQATRTLILIFFLLCSTGAAFSSHNAQSFTLAWNSNPEDNLGGYRIYIGFSNRQYYTNIFVGNVPGYTLTELPDAPFYYLALTAVSEDGSMESDFSDEIVIPRNLYLKASKNIYSGNLIVDLLGTPGKNYAVEVSSDFVSWTSFMVGRADSSGRIWGIDRLDLYTEPRFFRAVEN